LEKENSCKLLQLQMLFPVQQHDKNAAHKKEFPVTEETFSWKKETYLTPITGG
jgi:hypothetical protein